MLLTPRSRKRPVHLGPFPYEALGSDENPSSPSRTRVHSLTSSGGAKTEPILVPIATRLDDKLGNGRRVAAKKWCFDREVVEGATVVPRGVSRRDIEPRACPLHTESLPAARRSAGRPARPRKRGPFGPLPRAT
jgi:hypothetical protein